MSHIFISYSKKNSDYAYALADFLQEQGFNVWIDRVGIEYGVSWWDAIVTGLKGCGALIVIMTPEAKASEWVQREVFIALQDKKPVFPLLLNGNNWELFVLTQYVSVRDGSLPDADLLKRVSQYVTPKGKGVNQSTLTPPKDAPPTFDMDAAILAYYAAFRAKNWSEAQRILGRIRASGENPFPFDPDESERKVQAAIEREENERKRIAYETERDRQYRRVLTMSQHEDGATVWAALQKVWANFPDYDPDNLARFQPAPQRPRSVDLLPAPFAWVSIPAGKVTLEAGGYVPAGGQTFDVPAFAIAKYPVTNAQYRLFVDAGGYRERQWWTDAGWKQRETDKWTEPRYWNDPKWNGDEYPVVGVSWYEAVAFCQWLSAASGENVTLPTEQQWQRAAQGNDGRAYPWGKTWEDGRCNHSVGKDWQKNSTTSVRQFEGKGDSPFGVVDMTGNVWEWCLTSHNDGVNDINIDTEYRMLRGGSWIISYADDFRCAVRIRVNPHVGGNNWGFRLALS